MIMICTWNHTLAHNENDLKQATIFNISLRDTHTHTHTSIHSHVQLCNRPHLHLHSSFFPVILSWGYWKLPSAPLFFLPLIPFLSSLSLANKISSALIYSQASWTFLWAPWSPVSSLLPLLHPSSHPPPPPLHSKKKKKKMSDVTPYSHATQGSIIFLSLATILFSNWGFSCPTILFGLLQEAAWLECFSFWRLDRR